MEEKKRATAAKAAATKARNKKAKEEAAARALAAAQGEDEAPLASIKADYPRPPRLQSTATPSRLQQGRSGSEVDLCRRVLVTPPRGPRHSTPSEVNIASPSKIQRKKAKLNLCLRCSKRVFKDRQLLAYEKKNPMSRCEYCILTFALWQFNRLADSFHLYRDAKVNLSLAILEVASEVRSLRRTNRLGNDIQKAIHWHIPDVALAEGYESSDSEDDADREHVDGELEPD
ncbi:hypothetical protein VE00_09289 [Pseudogymnoascus sp. WSF 3629]|nr:hypothetical protein VE00_09289 [Pseudogymnoascus sp. WSF 3629]